MRPPTFNPQPFPLAYSTLPRPSYPHMTVFLWLPAQIALTALFPQPALGGTGGKCRRPSWEANVRVQTSAILIVNSALDPT